MGGTKLKRNSEAGVTMIEVMISSLILTVSLLAMAATMTQGISAMYITQEQLIAKQKARETLESVYTARSTQNITFAQIKSIADDGIFLEGYQDVRGMGTDGIANTADDAESDVETIIFPGPDGLLGTSDDESRSLDKFERRITFTDVLLPSGSVDEDIRKVTVDVRFQLRGVWWTVSVSSLISRFA